MTKSSKLFVLDTNVVLHDASCIYNFQENDIVVPITVIEELDQFKRGHGDLNFQAREFLRSLDALTGALLSEEGSRLGDQRGTIRVVLGHELHEAIRATFVRDAPDHRILSTALHLKEQNAGRPVVVVSKDTNLRMKAKAIGLCAGLSLGQSGELRQAVHGQTPGHGFERAD